MAEIYKDPLPGAPEGCTHNCMTCGIDEGCEVNSKGTAGSFWKALDNFSRIDSKELLDTLNSFSESDDEEEAKA